MNLLGMLLDVCRRRCGRTELGARIDPAGQEVLGYHEGRHWLVIGASMGSDDVISVPVPIRKR